MVKSITRTRTTTSPCLFSASMVIMMTLQETEELRYEKWNFREGGGGSEWYISLRPFGNFFFFFWVSVLRNRVSSAFCLKIKAEGWRDNREMHFVTFGLSHSFRPSISIRPFQPWTCWVCPISSTTSVYRRKRMLFRLIILIHGYSYIFTHSLTLSIL